MSCLTRTAALACCLLLGACNLRFGEQPPLVSGNSPANANGGANEMPQTVGSLPPGAEGIGRGPNATAPNDASITFGSGRR